MRITGISFDHMHMGDLLRQVHEHPEAEIVGICDANPDNRAAFETAAENFGLGPERQFSDIERCLEETRPELAILCPSTARHAEVVEQVARPGLHLLVEKPFAASLADADRMTAACERAGVQLFINWPLAWYPPHCTSKRLIDDGALGEVLEVHYYDGNRGPTYHLADKVSVSEAEALERMRDTWWYRKSEGGGSLLDYLGYGVTLGTWFMGGRKPIDVTCTTWARPGIEVDEHACCLVRYAEGLSKFETRWGTFSDPWEQQPQPKCGFVIVGSEGTLASYDCEDHVTLQTRAEPAHTRIPVDALPAGRRGPIEHVVDVLKRGSPTHGPLQTRIARIGQQIVDTAVLSAERRATVELLDT